MKFKEIFKKVGTWIEDNFTEILMGALAVSGFVVGLLLGKDAGYSKGLSDFRDDHINISKELIDNCGSIGAFVALDYAKQNPSVYERLISSHEEANNVYLEVEDLYYKTDYIHDLMDFYSSEGGD